MNTNLWVSDVEAQTIIAECVVDIRWLLRGMVRLKEQSVQGQYHKVLVTYMYV